MNREQLMEYISQQYNADADYPWIRYPGYTVFRHKSNRKWFAAVLNVPQNKIGLNSSEIIDILNVKCDPVMIGSLLKEEGFFPAYHMNKSNWITVALNSSVDDEKIKWLIDISFSLTNTKG